MNPRTRASQLQAGFTLIEVMVTLAIIAILTSIALPSYTAYVQRSRVPEALNALTAFATRMEQRYQDGAANSYAAAGGGCALVPANTTRFTLSCAVTNGGQDFLATATGTTAGQMSGYAFTINQRGDRATTAHPKGTNAACWSTRGTVCDG